MDADIQLLKWRVDSCGISENYGIDLYDSVVLVSIRQILLVIVLFLERILESSLVLVLGGSNTCSFSSDYR